MELDVVRLSPSPRSQARARARRAANLALLALAHGADTILTAHHEDDVLETALMNLTRGASSAGIASLAREVAPIAGVPGALGVRWCRPMLGCSRRSLERFWGERAHAIDPSNETDDYRRNRVRRNVLPALLEEPGARSGALATIGHLADEARALEARAASMADLSWSRVTPLRVQLDLTTLGAASHHDADLAAHWRLLGRALPSTGGWTRAHLIALSEMARGEGAGEIVLPGAHASRRGDRMIVEVFSGRGAPARVAHPVTLDTSSPGQVRWFGGTLSWTRGATSDGSLGPCEAHITAPALALTLRGIQPGDRLDSGGRVLKLKELARAAEVHARERWRAPCVCVRDAPIWLVGVRRGARAEAPAGGVGVVSLRWYPAERDRK